MHRPTTIQLRALKFIFESFENQEHIPTLRELCDHMGYKAIGSAQDIVSALRKKGYLKVPDRQSARSLLLTESAKKLVAGMDEGIRSVMQEVLKIPCLGSVPAGNPLEAIEQSDRHLSFTSSMLPSSTFKNNSDVFALQASGSSMVNAGIHDGDWLIVESCQHATIGTIVIARMDNDATVKRLLKDNSRGFFLKPENEEFENIYADETPFEIIGRVIALQRSF